ncbi:aldolase [Dioszegia hungarica]|uniref:Aldolase n=1 Tax=Dioszegia hungarica TaxID=4972 RepID=A0AA38HEH5_9TREE|nr:aldolase [Dioszegia hungarica]KAI9638720.1 aldolase [Dioszegia hungarica]
MSPSTAAMSALSLLRSRLSANLDQLSPELAEKYGPFCDMTSNPAVLAALIASDTHIEDVRRAVARARTEAEGDMDETIELAIDMLVVTISKLTLDHLTGRVHAQVSPRHALSVESTILHAHRLIRLFAWDGISPGRICLQIPATGAGMVAAAQLEKSGIRTCATTVFSLPQALAAEQAGCLYVAPYFNDMAVLFQPGTWRAYNDPGMEHPMSGVIRDIVDAYEGMVQKAGKGIKGHRPEVMVMNLVTPGEALAVSTLGVDHISLSGKVMEELAGGKNEATFMPEVLDEHEAILQPMELDDEMGSKKAKGKGKEKVPVATIPDTDWLADDGAALDEAIRSDEEVSRKLEYAVKAFEECEARIAIVIRQMLLAS